MEPNDPVTGKRKQKEREKQRQHNTAQDSTSQQQFNSYTIMNVQYIHRWPVSQQVGKTTNK